MKPPLPRLLLITDSTVCTDLPGVVAAALAGGVRHVLLREKGMAAGPLTLLARTLRALTAAWGAHLLIHDRVDVALAVGADGVQLPENGLATVEARRLWAHGLVGRSCHTVAGACQALQAGADFVTLSPLFATPSHPETPPLGLARLAAMRASIPGPVLALGGIRRDNIAEAMSTGVDGIALIRGILDTRDPCLAARTLLALMDEGLPVPG
ncbi:MAG: thiamine phosphate synthase [Magnetococcales bacterium]|nr:thiamine phosphate synthase [Magnetococcales bacterium]